ncbi:hypothetical protein, partial [Moraxella catarrhalis]|uniref:hypothetical protein n=1 Tax=Moraxella catarrhalis TaxID=480 RepID=UPI001D0DB8B4
MFWGTTGYSMPLFWQEALDRSSLNSAIRLIPVGVAAFIVSVCIQIWPRILAWRRWPIFVNMAIVSCMMILYTQSEGGPGKKYWQYLVPAFVIGSGLCQFTFLAINVFIITSVPPHR